jgi:hypothetical protein
MYCSKCGQAVGAQPICPSCGTPTGIGTPAAGIPFVPASRIARHLRTLGILWIAFSIYLVLRWVLVLPFLRGWLGANPMWMHGPYSPNAWMYGPLHPGSWLLHVIAIMVLVRFVLSLAVGVALLTRQPWGRVFAIVIAVLTLIKPILGTVLAIYTLWVLLGHNARQDYDRMRVSNEARPL